MKKYIVNKEKFIISAAQFISTNLADYKKAVESGDRQKKKTALTMIENELIIGKKTFNDACDFNGKTIEEYVANTISISDPRIIEWLASQICDEVYEVDE